MMQETMGLAVTAKKTYDSPNVRVALVALFRKEPSRFRFYLRPDARCLVQKNRAGFTLPGSTFLDPDFGAVTH
jgi:hypothetical protein